MTPWRGIAGVEWQGKGALEELMRERIRATIEAHHRGGIGGGAGCGTIAARGFGSRRVSAWQARANVDHQSWTQRRSPCRGHVFEDDDGQRREWRSRMIPRYQRRTERVDEAILGVYLSGTNTRRLRGALAPLLRGAPLSKDAVSRLVGRLREDFEAWAQRDLGELKIRYLFLDGWYPRVRIGKKRVRVPVLVTLGVCANGQRVVLDLRLAGVESEQAWLDAVRSLSARNLGAPVLAVIDGNPGLTAALKMQWPQIAIQRCTNHKLWNLLAKAPAHLREELAEDYRRMIYAESREAVEQARVGFAAQVEAALQDRQRQLRGGRRRALHLYRFPALAMEGAAHHQRAGANQRGISPADQNPGFAPQRRGGAVLALRPPAQRPGYSAPPGRLARPSHHQRTTGGCIVTT